MTDKRLIGGKYRIIKKLGEGASKIVYLAADESLGGRLVALHKFKQHEMNEIYLAQIQREAEILASLEHPHIVRIYELFQDIDWYMATEYLEGGSLKEKIRNEWKHRPDVPVALRIAAEVAEALDFVHSGTNGRPIYHRDVKPSNILIGRDGMAKLTDFGLAKPWGDTLTGSSDAIVGTLPYMSPEQVSSIPPDKPADMYSFGVTLYEMVVGQRPFHGSDASVLVHHLHSIPPPPSNFYPGINRRLQSLILSLLGKNPSERPSAKYTATELRNISVEISQTDGLRTPPPETEKEPPPYEETEIPTDEQLRKARLSKSLQHPLTLIPIFLAGMALIVYAAFPSVFGFDRVLLGCTLFIGIGCASFANYYYGSYRVEYEEEKDRAGEMAEEASNAERLDALKTGFARAGSPQGARALENLSYEHRELKAVLGRERGSSSLPLARFAHLADEAYEEGLQMLEKVLILLTQIESGRKNELELDISGLIEDIRGMEASGEETQAIEIRRRLKDDLKSALEKLERIEARADEYLLQARVSEMGLNSARIELASLRAGDSQLSFNTVIESLQNAIEQAKRVQEEIENMDMDY